MRVAILLLLSLTLPLRGAEVRVFAAASLTDALAEIARGYERETTDRVVFNFAGSSMLARQVEAGAPADLLLSADDLVRTTRLGERATFLSNALVIVARDKRITHPRDLVGLKVALGEPSTVPAGIYARAYLQKLGLWERVKTNVIPTDNVRGALAAVVSGNVDAAIVYRTDARISKEVRVAYEVPRAEGPRIAYLFAIVKDAEQPRAARRFFLYLQSKRALDVFRKHGFDVRH
jgi:molybdate transport system substrate-binding protein